MVGIANDVAAHRATHVAHADEANFHISFPRLPPDRPTLAILWRKSGPMSGGTRVSSPIVLPFTRLTQRSVYVSVGSFRASCSPPPVTNPLRVFRGDRVGQAAGLGAAAKDVINRTRSSRCSFGCFTEQKCISSLDPVRAGKSIQISLLSETPCKHRVTPCPIDYFVASGRNAQASPQKQNNFDLAV
jgi:hypothetical protein